MRQRLTSMAVVAGAVVALLLTGGASAFHRDDAVSRDASLEAATMLRPVAGQTAAGLVRLSAHRGGPTSLRGILVGLTAASVRIGVTELTCAQANERPRADINDIYVFRAPLAPGPNGTALLEHEGIFYAKLREARSAAIVGDWNGDGRDEIGACGDLSKQDVDWGSRARGRSVVGEGASLEGAPSGSFLAYERIGPDIRGNALVAAAGLAAGTEHGLGLSRRSCEGLEGAKGQRPRTKLLRFTTDASGSALASFRERRAFSPGSLRTARSMFIAARESSGIAVVACAELRDGRMGRRGRNGRGG